MSAPGFFQGIADVLGGKGELRLIVQPALAILLGIRLGISDAREGRTPFVLRVFTAPRENVRLALHDVIVPFCIAIAVDAILQHATLGHVRPVAASVVKRASRGTPRMKSRSLRQNGGAIATAAF